MLLDAALLEWLQRGVITILLKEKGLVIGSVQVDVIAMLAEGQIKEKLKIEDTSGTPLSII